MGKSLLLGRSCYDAIGREKIGDEDPVKDLAEDLVDNRGAAAWLDKLEAKMLVAKAPQPGGKPPDTPARLVNMEIGAHPGLLLNVLVDWCKDFDQAVRDLDQGTGGKRDIG
jgi:hypothetical protein